MGIVAMLRRVWASRASRKGAIRSKRRQSRRLTFRPLFDILEDRLAPAVDIWTGVTDGNWNNPSNWNSTPNPGDDLVFPAHATNLTITNNGPGMSFNSITFTGSGYAVGGTGTITLGAGSLINNEGGTNTYGLATTLTTSQTIWNNGTLLLTNTLTLAAGNTLTFDGGGTTIVTSTGTIIGGGNIIAQGGNLVLASANSGYTGNTTITQVPGFEGGAVTVQNGLALGTTGTVTINRHLAGCTSRIASRCQGASNSC